MKRKTETEKPEIDKEKYFFVLLFYEIFSVVLICRQFPRVQIYWHSEGKEKKLDAWENHTCSHLHSFISVLEFHIICLFVLIFFFLFYFPENATRHCFENGTWSTSNYSLCLNIEGTISESMFDETITSLTSTLYYIGYSVSVVALLIAMFIFLYFK